MKMFKVTVGNADVRGAGMICLANRHRCLPARPERGLCEGRTRLQSCCRAGTRKPVASL